MTLRSPFLALCIVTFSAMGVEPSRVEVEEALLRAARFFRESVSRQGAYLWQYSADLSQREGEGKATQTQGWIQPPGTPSVGLAYLAAWNATTNDYFLEAARETASAVIRGQLRSGGWHYAVELDPNLRQKIAYRHDGAPGKGRNVTTFDDDTTQAALRFLVQTEAALNFNAPRIRDSVRHALQAIAKAQYPNGAFPQGYETFPEQDKFPVRDSKYPSEWSRSWPGSQQYWLRYTLNDNNLSTLVDTFLEIARHYDRAKNDPEARALSVQCRQMAGRIGDFLILAQMPNPQPAWAQQYNFEMEPAWARKFEPPAISGLESQSAIRALLNLYRETGHKKYLLPIPKALAWLQKSRLPDGQLARFYELSSNRPLYFTRDYQLTYSDSDLPTHYSFKVRDQTDSIAKEFEKIKSASPSEPSRTIATKKPSSEDVRKILASLDHQGRWIESGKMKSYGPKGHSEIIRSATFVRNMETLGNYLSARE